MYLSKLKQQDFVRISDYQPLPKKQYSISFIKQYRVIKLMETEQRVAVGVVNIEDELMVETLHVYHNGKNIDFYPIENSDLSSYISRQLSDIGGEDNSNSQQNAIAVDDLTFDAPVVNLINGILIEGVRQGASDVHIESLQDSVWVRFRINGVLQKITTFSLDKFEMISSRLKVMADLNIMERRLPQDGRFSISLENSSIDVRISFVPIQGGESIVLRLFKKNEESLSLSELGFGEEQLNILKLIYKSANGLILVTGPTGSGKTTTLHALLKEFVEVDKKYITIEDPIENNLSGVDQIQINESIGLTFESVLRRILRQDPDVIMVGEIRDEITANLAVRAALTGHLVLATLHTNDSVSSIQRLLNMHIPSYLLADVIRGASAQRLYRVLCPHCRSKYSPSTGEKRMLDEIGLPLDEIYKAEGCSSCNFTGYSTRRSMMEIFSIDKQLSQMIASSASFDSISKNVEKKGMIPLKRRGLELIAMGHTTFEEMERIIGF